MPRSVYRKIAVLGLLFYRAVANASSPPTSVTVLPFAAREGSSQVWLSKGLADLFVQHLARVPSLAVLEREQLQTFLNEMALGQAPLFDQSNALRVGRVAKVDSVIYGSYALAGSTVRITAFWLDLTAQAVLSTEEAEGPVENLVPLVRATTEKLLQKRGTPLTAQDRERLHVHVTDSFSALEHFYRGMDFYDRGHYPESLGEWLAATERDANYLDAQLWTGRAYDAQGADEHAVLAYESLFKKYPQEVEAWDALLFAGKILRGRLHAPARAIADWRTVVRVAPDSSHALEASYQLGECLEDQEKPLEAYHAYQLLEKGVQRARNDKLQTFRQRHRPSRFFSWDHALALAPEALANSILLFQRLRQDMGNVSETAPRGVFVLDPAHAEFGERFGQTPSLFVHPDGNSGNGKNWREETYAVVAPPGYEASGVSMELTGRLLVNRADRDFSMRIYPFPLPRDPQQGWIGVLYGQTANTQTLRKTVSFHGNNLRIFTLQFFQLQGEIVRWKIRVHLKPIGAAKISMDAPMPQASSDFWEGKLLAQLPLPPQTRTGATRTLTESFYRPQRDLAIAQDGAGQLTVVATVGDMDSSDVDLWSATGHTGKPWTLLQPLPINSRGVDWSPRLARGEDGRLRLFWISNRRGLGWELYLSEQDQKGNWSVARRLALEKWEAPQTSPSDAVENLLEYAVTQDRRGRWLVAYSVPASGEVVVLASRDFENWSLLSKIPAGSPHGLALAQDSSERIVLAGWPDSGELHVWISNDAKTWTDHILPDAPLRDRAAHRLEMIPEASGKIWFIYSDKHVGPRAIQWTPPEGRADALLPLPRTRLESLAATPFDRGSTAVVLREQDHLAVRVYRHFVTEANGRRGDFRGFVGQEVEADTEGNVWTRAFPVARFVVPDVTAVGIEPERAGEKDARVWFGIETGIFFHQGDAFEKTDVSEGFFDHFVTDIASCKNLPTYFVSRERSEPVLGVAIETGGDHRFSTIRIAGAQGAVTGIGCGNAPGQLMADTADGKTWELENNQWTNLARSLGPAATRRTLLMKIKDPVYASIGAIAQDPRGGLWYLPDDETPSKGVAYFNGQTTKLYNPPHATLEAPSSLAVDANGAVWIGTWFNGLYKLEKNRGGDR